LAAIAVVAIVVVAAVALSGNANNSDNDNGLPDNGNNNNNGNNNDDDDDDDDDDGNNGGDGIYEITEEDGVTIISGTGSVKTSTFNMDAGVAIVTLNYIGEEVSNFIVEFCSEGVDNYELVVNVFGPYSGTRLVGVVEGDLVGVIPGDVYVEVTSQGAWEISIEQPEVTQDDASTGAVYFAGPLDQVVGPFYFDSKVTFDFTHEGDGPFLVRLYSNDGGFEGNLASRNGEAVESNTIDFSGGAGSGYGYKLDSGIYWIEVIGADDWTVDVTPEIDW